MQYYLSDAIFPQKQKQNRSTSLCCIFYRIKQIENFRPQAPNQDRVKAIMMQE